MALPVFFIRGLSTQGSDNAYWSFVDAGPMSRQLHRGLGERGIEMIPVNGMGHSGILELSKRVRSILEEHPVWRDPATPVHLFGHSAGGLVARLLAAQKDIPPGKIKSIITVATPNTGSIFAEHCLRIPQEFPNSTRFLQALGYNVRRVAGFMPDLTRESVLKIIQEHGRIPSNIEQASIVCWAPRSEWCWPLRLIYKVPCFDAFTLPTDGMVERDSQSFGKVIAEIKIDHIRQIGLFGAPEKFAELCGTLAEFFNR